jgi:hypothetical protein
MKNVLNFISKAIFVFIIVEFFKGIWKGSLIGKIVLLSMLAFGIYQTYFNQPAMIHLTR